MFLLPPGWIGCCQCPQGPAHSEMSCVCTHVISSTGKQWGCAVSSVPAAAALCAPLAAGLAGAPGQLGGWAAPLQSCPLGPELTAWNS